MLRTVTCRLYPTAGQASRLFHFLYTGRKLYNHSLEQRIKFYKETGKSLSYFDQQNDLTVLRAVSVVLHDFPVWIARDALKRLDRAFDSFFRRLKGKKEKPGFPRFKSANRWNTFGIWNPGKAVRNGRIRVTGVSELIKTKGLQDFTGKIKQLHVTHRAGKWFCGLIVDDGQKPPTKKPVHSSIGIDVGLESFATLSDGGKILNPRFYRKAQRRLARASRAVCRKKKGSNNRRKAVHRLQRVHEYIRGQRWHFMHSASKRLISRFDLIAAESLSINGMVRNSHFSKSILDAAWGHFLWQLEYKAENAGVQFLKVDPRGTSQECSGCGMTVAKTLKERTHRCPGCGLVLHRDHNAALNILRRAASPVVTTGSRACEEVQQNPNEASSLTIAAT